MASAERGSARHAVVANPPNSGSIGGTCGAAHVVLGRSTAASLRTADRKTRVAKRYGRPSYGVGLSFRANGKDFDTDARLDTSLYAAHGGVFPITVLGVGMVGTVGVSGLPQANDHALVVEHLRAWLDGLAGENS